MFTFCLSFANPITIPASHMNSKVRPWLPSSLLLLLLLLCSLLTLSFSSHILRHLLQSDPPANATSHPSKHSDTVKIAAAVLITAAVSFYLSALLFFSIHRFLTKRRKSEPQIYLTNPMPPFHRSKIDQNLRSVPVDDSALDVFYWQSINEPTPKRCYQCNSLLKRSSDEDDDLPMRRTIFFRRRRAGGACGRMTEVAKRFRWFSQT